jgi:para-nitrobenzyl esterase
MTLKQLGIENNEWRELLEVPADKLTEAQTALGRSGGGPLGMNGGRKGMGAGSRPGGFGPVVDGAVLPRHPFDPEAPSISKEKPLLVGYNRDETLSSAVLLNVNIPRATRRGHRRKRRPQCRPRCRRLMFMP